MTAWAQAPVDLKSMLGQSVSLEPLSAAMINRVAEALLTFEKQGLHAFADSWSEYDWLRGRCITVQQPGGSISGKAFGIDSDGALLVQGTTTTTRVISGSIVADGIGSAQS